MSEQPEEQEQQVVVIGPDGQPMGSVPASALHVTEVPTTARETRAAPSPSSSSGRTR